MGRTAVIYASGFTKNTKKLAEYMARKTDADIFNLKEQTDIDLKDFDTVVIGTGIHAGNPYKPAVDFIEKNRDVLSSKKLKIFVSCMYNGEKGDRQKDALGETFGFPVAAYFNKKAENMNEEGFPAAVDEFIADL
ncbi:MAG: hypothetical protein IJ856_02105 [Candidatus Methanomethylophilaceae archaeon]|nr:hypothetical protein [Candidatus Methanomethylophilaceae archaeon]